jgi:catechol 2,3-dioxygenase-like lactoylglutathione lyase family enzyme
MKKPAYQSKNIRTFIGAKDFETSRTFYKELGFEEIVLDEKMVLIKMNDDLAFYLQKYYVKDWVNNSMVFLEVDDIDQCWQDLNERGLHHKYKYVRLSEIKTFEWGRECFLHDPSGVLWHFGQFN